MMKIIFAILTVATMFIGVDCSGKVMKITESWSRATPADATTAQAYAIIQNRTGADDTLTLITSYIAESATIATTTNVNGIDETKEVASLVIPADKDVVLSPNRTFILFKKLKQPLKAGEKFPLTLTFEKGGQVTEDVLIEPAGTHSFMK